ncbi:MAG: 1-acyl-sn-glycerol-3-phosphate acyltransferase [Gammaproteobacteria bacterium]|nr:1-acyl-sn-glycerol-3-phosphate acyltransferase [Gammaproteobacteria bacterium]
MIFWITTSLILLILFLTFIGLRARVIDWGNPVVNVIDGLFRLYLRYYHHYQYEPIDLPEHGPALLASNHISGLDPFLILGACKRPVRFMIAREEYERFGLKWLFRAVGCIPVDRSGKPDVAFREALVALRGGEVIGLFPEGAIHTSNEPPKRLKRGVVFLAELAGVAVYPVTVSGVGAEGEVVKAVFKRGQPRLTPHPVMNCTAVGHDACLEQLAQLFRQ